MAGTASTQQLGSQRESELPGKYCCAMFAVLNLNYQTDQLLFATQSDRLVNAEIWLHQW